MINEKIIAFIADEDVLTLIPAYLESCRSHLDALSEAATQRDFEILRGIGHKIKGSGSTYGLDRISEIGGLMESSAIAQNFPDIEREIGNLRDFLDRVEVRVQ